MLCLSKNLLFFPVSIKGKSNNCWLFKWIKSKTLKNVSSRSIFAQNPASKWYQTRCFYRNTSYCRCWLMHHASVGVESQMPIVTEPANQDGTQATKKRRQNLHKIFWEKSKKLEHRKKEYHETIFANSLKAGQDMQIASKSMLTIAKGRN